jgi:hypothetical protein
MYDRVENCKLLPPLAFVPSPMDVEGFKLPNRMMPSADIYRVVQRQKKEKLYKNT